MGARDRIERLLVPVGQRLGEILTLLTETCQDCRWTPVRALARPRWLLLAALLVFVLILTPVITCRRDHARNGASDLRPATTTAQGYAPGLSTFPPGASP